MSSTAQVAPRAQESPRTAKSVRQRAILDLVRARAIRTQDELVDALRGLHLDVTQATVSRDVRDLGLVRAADGEGLRYVSGVGDVDPQGPSSRVRAVFRDHVRSIEFVDHLGVVRGRPSTAPLVAAAIDAAHFDEVAGTVAGDDTVLIVARGRAAASQLRARLESFIGVSR
jgi:transcriptional regulator of arginine metabolism